MAHIRAAVRALSAPTTLKCPVQSDLGLAPPKPLPKRPEARGKLRLSHAAGSPTPSPVLAGPHSLHGFNLVLALCTVIAGPPVKSVTVTSLVPLGHCRTLLRSVRALSCRCWGHPQLLAHPFSWFSPCSLLPDSAMHPTLFPFAGHPPWLDGPWSMIRRSITW